MGAPLTRYGFTLASMTTSQYQEAVTYLKLKMPELYQQHQYLDEPWDEAIARFGQVRDLKLKSMDSNSPEEQEVYGDYYYHTGCAYLQAGKIELALDEFIMGRKHSPSNLNLAWVYTFVLSLHRKEKEGV
jgi:hypothetical protein